MQKSFEQNAQYKCRRIKKKCNLNEKVRSSVSFPDFTRPKTALQLGTEHGLTSEFETGSGGTRALWPTTIRTTSREPYISLGCKSQKTRDYIHH